MLLEPDEFIARWKRQWRLSLPDEEPKFAVSPPHLLAARTISDSDKAFLIRAGLPADAAPFLSFREVEYGLPRLWEVYGGLPGRALHTFRWTEEEMQRTLRYAVIGSDGAGNPLCIDEAESGCVVLLDHEDHFHTVQFVNSGIRHLAACLLAFVEQGPNEVRAAISGIDPFAMNEGHFWWHEAAGLEYRGKTGLP